MEKVKMQTTIIKFKTELEKLHHDRNILYIDLLNKLKQITNRKIELCKNYVNEVKEIDEEIQKYYRNNKIKVKSNGKNK
jgi:hypothetical protein